MIMFANDIKLWRNIKTEKDSKILQKDFDALTKWSNKYLLKFNPQKYKLICTSAKQEVSTQNII